MAHEITTITKLYCDNSVGGYLPSHTVSKTIAQVGFQLGDATQTITNAAAQVIVVPAGITGDRFLEIVNLGVTSTGATSTSYVNVSIDNAGTKYVFSKLKLSSSILIQPTGAIYAAASAADGVIIQIRVCDV
jgi:hypothetical protein